MPDSEDYRLYLEGEFKGLHKLMNAQFDTVHDKFDSLEKKTDRIEAQTIRTNCRVTDLEVKDIKHIIDCPVAIDLKEVKDDLIEYKMIKKYPKIMIGIIVVFVFIGLAWAWEFNKKIASLKSEVNMINTPVRTRGGKIILLPSGVLTDTLKNDTIRNIGGKVK